MTDATAINENTLIRIGLEEPGEPYELLKVVKVDKKANTITVERGPEMTLDDALVGSDAMAHEAGATIYNGPQLPPARSSATRIRSHAALRPEQGRTRRPPLSLSTSLMARPITLGDNFFEIDGQNEPRDRHRSRHGHLRHADNSGAAIHNLRIAGPDGEYNTDDDIVSDPDAITGGATGTITFNSDRRDIPLPVRLPPGPDEGRDRRSVARPTGILGPHPK